MLPLLAGVVGCAAGSTRDAHAPVLTVNAPSATNTAAAHGGTATSATINAENGAKPLPQAVAALAAEGVTGAIALFDSRSGSLYCSDVSRCTRGYLPASTFKVPLAAIALETGILSDAESVLPWDGKPYTNADWNHDNTLRTAV